MSPLEILRLLQKKFRFSSEESKSITSIPSWRERGSWLIYAWPGLKSRGELLFIPRGSAKDTRESQREQGERGEVAIFENSKRCKFSGDRDEEIFLRFYSIRSGYGEEKKKIESRAVEEETGKRQSRRD